MEEMGNLTAKRAEMLAEAQEERVRAEADRVSLRAEIGDLRKPLDQLVAASDVWTT